MMRSFGRRRHLVHERALVRLLTGFELEGRVLEVGAGSGLVTARLVQGLAMTSATIGLPAGS